MPIKPTDQEEEYFAKQEFERRRQMLAEQESRSGEEERLRLWPRPVAAAKGWREARCRALPRRGDRQVLTLQGIWLDVGELAQVTGSDERGFLGSLGRIFGG